MTDVVAKLWPDAKVVPYGSTITNHCLPVSDLDMAVVGPRDVLGDEPWFKLANQLIAEAVCFPEFLSVISTTKVPIIKLSERIFGYSCDISFGVDPEPMLKLISEWDTEFQQLRPLVLIVKSLLNQRMMNCPYNGGLGSITLVVMIHHFLRTLTDEIANDPENVTALAVGLRKSKLKPSSPLGPLLLQFLQYFAHFPYETRAVLADGRAMRKPLATLEPPQLEPWTFVVLNPLIPDRHVNMAASSYNMLHVSSMFGAVEKQLRNVLNLTGRPIKSIWLSVYTEDFQIQRYRDFVSHRLKEIKALSLDRKREAAQPAQSVEEEEEAENQVAGNNNRVTVSPSPKKMRSTNSLKEVQQQEQEQQQQEQKLLQPTRSASMNKAK